MQPDLFTLPGAARVGAWGALFCLGWALALWVGGRRLAVAGLPARAILEISAVALVAGLAGGRLLYELQYGSLGQLFRLTGSGMVFYGGFLLAVPAVLLLLFLRGLPVLRSADALAPSVAVGLAFSRVGCFLNGCCYGDLCHPGLPWAARHPRLAGGIIPLPQTQFLDGVNLALPARDAVLAAYPFPPLHPVQLYASAADMAIFCALSLVSSRRRFPGEVLLALGLLYAPARFLLEAARNDTPPLAPLGLTFSQHTSLVLFLVCLGLWVHLARRPRVPQTTSVP